MNMTQLKTMRILNVSYLEKIEQFQNLKFKLLSELDWQRIGEKLWDIGVFYLKYAY